MLGGFSLNSHTTALRLGGYSCAHLPNGRPEAPRSQCPLSQGYQGAEARPNSGLIYCLFPCSFLRIAAFSGISVFHFLIRDPETFWAVYFDQRPHPIHIFIMPPNKQTNTPLLTVLPNIDEKTTRSRMRVLWFENAEFMSGFKESCKESWIHRRNQSAQDWLIPPAKLHPSWIVLLFHYFLSVSALVLL